MMPARDYANEGKELLVLKLGDDHLDQRPRKSLPPTLHHYRSIVRHPSFLIFSRCLRGPRQRPCFPGSLAAWHKVQKHVLKNCMHRASRGPGQQTWPDSSWTDASCKAVSVVALAALHAGCGHAAA